VVSSYSLRGHLKLRRLKDINFAGTMSHRPRQFRVTQKKSIFAFEWSLLIGVLNDEVFGALPIVHRKLPVNVNFLFCLPRNACVRGETGAKMRATGGSGRLLGRRRAEETKPDRYTPQKPGLKARLLCWRRGRGSWIAMRSGGGNEAQPVDRQAKHHKATMRPALLFQGRPPGQFTARLCNTRPGG